MSRFIAIFIACFVLFGSHAMAAKKSVKADPAININVNFDMKGLAFGMKDEEVKEKLSSFGKPELRKKSDSTYSLVYTLVDFGQYRNIKLSCSFFKGELNQLAYLANVRSDNEKDEKKLRDMIKQKATNDLKYYKKDGNYYENEDNNALVEIKDTGIFFYAKNSKDIIQEEDKAYKLKIAKIEDIVLTNQNWEKIINVSKLDDTKSIIFINTSLDSIQEKAGKYIKPTFILRCHEGELSAYVNWGVFLSTHDIPVTTRIDKEPAYTTDWKISSDFKSTFERNPDEFMNKINYAKRIVMKVTPYADSPKIVEFDVSEIDQIVRPLMHACPYHKMIQLDKALQFMK